VWCIVAKLTKRDQLVRISEVLANVGAPIDLSEFVLAEIARLDKRKSAPRALTATQRENIVLKQRIFGIVADADEAPRAGDIAKALDISVQRATALLKQLVTDNLVIRETDKKVTTFRVKE